MAVDKSAWGSTVILTLEACRPPKLPENTTEPGLTAVARPLLLLMVATAGFELCQLAVRVRSCVLPSEKVPINWTGWAEPVGNSLSEAFTARAVMVALVTITVLCDCAPP